MFENRTRTEMDVRREMGFLRALTRSDIDNLLVRVSEICGVSHAKFENGECVIDIDRNDDGSVRCRCGMHRSPRPELSRDFQVAFGPRMNDAVDRINSACNRIVTSTGFHSASTDGLALGVEECTSCTVFTMSIWQEGEPGQPGSVWKADWIGFHNVAEPSERDIAARVLRLEAIAELPEHAAHKLLVASNLPRPVIVFGEDGDGRQPWDTSTRLLLGQHFDQEDDAWFLRVCVEVSE